MVRTFEMLYQMDMVEREVHQYQLLISNFRKKNQINE